LKDTRFFAMIPDHVKQGRQVNVGTTQKNTGTTAPASGPAFGAFGALNTGQGQAQSKPAAPSQGTTVGVPVQGTTTVPAVHQPGQSTSGEPVAGSTTVTVAAPAGTTPVGLDPAAMNSTLDQLRKTAASINGGNQGQ